jgi:alpha-amylase
MCTKFFSDGEVHKYFNPYDTPYEAFINYMNVISDFQIRLDEKRAALDVKETAVEELKEKPVRKKAVKKK